MSIGGVSIEAGPSLYLIFVGAPCHRGEIRPSVCSSLVVEHISLSPQYFTSQLDTYACARLGG